MNQKRIKLYGFCGNYSGWCLSTYRVMLALELKGWEVFVEPLWWRFMDNGDAGKVEEYFKRHVVGEGEHPDLPKMVLMSPYEPRFSKYVQGAIAFTMWESTRIPKRIANQLNRAQSIIVPSEWNIHLFSASGVNAPMYRVPYGVDTSVFKPVERKRNNNFVYLAGGRGECGGLRKNLDMVVNAFEQLNGNCPNTELWIKSFPDEDVDNRGNPKIKVIRDFLTEEELANLYAKADCFISLSSSEGWGWMPHEAMAVGRPCIAPRFSGMSDYFDDYVGYCVDYDCVRSKGIYDDFAHGSVWAQPRMESVIEEMYRAVEDDTLWKLKSKRSTARAQSLNAVEYANNLDRALTDILEKN